MDIHKSIMRPFNLHKWIDENKSLLKPPVGNKRMYTDSEFIVMIVGGPNSRKDYHYEEGEELFYQIKGDILVKIQENGKVVDIPIREGEIFLLPPRVPHSPIRGPDTVGLVVERERKPHELDKCIWYCEKCNTQLFEEEFYLKDVQTSLQEIFKIFYGSEELRTCKECQHVMDPPSNPL